MRSTLASSRLAFAYGGLNPIQSTAGPELQALRRTNCWPGAVSACRHDRPGRKGRRWRVVDRQRELAEMHRKFWKIWRFRYPITATIMASTTGLSWPPNICRTARAFPRDELISVDNAAGSKVIGCAVIWPGRNAICART